MEEHRFGLYRSVITVRSLGSLLVGECGSARGSKNAFDGSSQSISLCEEDSNEGRVDGRIERERDSTLRAVFPPCRSETSTRERFLQLNNMAFRCSLQYSGVLFSRTATVTSRRFLRHALIVPWHMVDVTLHEARKKCRGIRWLLHRWKIAGITL